MKKLLLALAVLCLPCAAYADITIGAYGPLTGPVASESDYWKVGIEQAIEDVNARGGVLGQKLKLEMMDDACDPRQAVAVMNRMVTKNVKAILSGSCSGAILAASPISDEVGIPQIVTVALNSAITDHGWGTVYRMSGRDNDHARVAVAYLLQKARGKKIAIIHDKSAVTRGLADLAEKGLREAGEREVELLAINPGENDLSPIIAKLKNDGIDAVYLALFMREGGLFVRQAKDQKFLPLMVGAQPLSLLEFKRIAGDAADGVYVVNQKVPEPIPADVIERLRKRGHVEPAVHTYINYAGIETLAQAMEQEKSAEAVRISVALHKGRFQTIMGESGFNDKGDSSLAVGLYQWHGAGLVSVQ